MLRSKTYDFALSLGLIFALSGSGCQTTPKASAHDERLKLEQQVYGITKEEAEFRLSDAHISEFRQVHDCAKRQDGFAAFTLHRTPVYTLEAYFKGNAAQKLANCTHNPFYQPFDVEFSEADLQATFDAVKAKLNEEGMANIAQLIPYGWSVTGLPELDRPKYTHGGFILVTADEDQLPHINSILAPLIPIHPRLVIAKAPPIDDFLLPLIPL